MSDQYTKADMVEINERIESARRAIRSARTITSDFKLRDRAVAEAEAEERALIAERDEIRAGLASQGIDA